MEPRIGEVAGGRTTSDGRQAQPAAANGRARNRLESAGRVDADFVSLLEGDGLHAALAFLNGRVRYRFTGVYRFDPPVLRNVDLFDRENPSLSFTGCELVLLENYCGIVRATERPFTVTDATRDPRLEGYASRTTMVSYLGVPIRENGGGLFGTLCHFDGRPRLAPKGEVETMGRLAMLLAPWLLESAADT